MKAADTRKEVRGAPIAIADGYDCGQVRTCFSEKVRDRYIRQETFACLILQFRCIYSHWFPPSPPPLLSLLGYPASHHLSFPSMYIFRSWVIKSAPEGTGLNRISLSYCPAPTMLLKQKYTIACMSITKHANTNGQSAFLWLCFFTFLSL